MERHLLWLWLTLKFTPGTDKITKLIKYFNNIDAVYSAEDYSVLTFLSDKERNRLCDKSLDEAYSVCEKTLDAKAKIITYDDKAYPNSLRNIHNPPYVLYIKGEYRMLDDYLIIGVVGTRKYSEYGAAVTRKIASELVRSGVVIVTGLALGIDAIASDRAVKYKAYSIGVLGCGIDRVYPAQNKELFDEMEKYGLIISEYPPGTPPERENFPIRNRIIAGLSRGVLVTEAPKRSGALITADLALENGRDVYSVPRSIFDTGFSGTNRLLQQGAKSIVCAEDILVEYPYDCENLKKIIPDVFVDIPDTSVNKKTFTPEKRENTEKQESTKKKRKIIIPDNLNETAKKIAELLEKGVMHTDELVRESGMTAARIHEELIMLELSDIIESVSENKYKLKEAE